MEFANFPFTVIEVLTDVKQSARFIKVKEDFQEINNLDYDLFGLNGHFETDQWIIELKNLRNNDIIHQWSLKETHHKKSERLFSRNEPRGPILLENYGLIVMSDESNNLYRLDSQSNITWHNADYQYHHAINQDADGNIWVCGREQRNIQKPKNRSIKYWDNSIVKIDVESGTTLLHLSLSDVFMDNGLGYFIHGMGNEVQSVGKDPLHLNDIEPVFVDGQYWKKGDLLLSFRHRSLIILYRPSTKKIIRVIQGEFYNQHDVDLFSENEISLFNNNFSSLGGRNRRGNDISKEHKDSSNVNVHAEVLVYNMTDSTYKSKFADQFKDNSIFTESQGLHRFLSNGDLFVEDQNNGLVFIFNDKELVYRNYYNPPNNGYVERPHWVRIYEQLK